MEKFVLIICKCGRVRQLGQWNYISQESLNHIRRQAGCQELFTECDECQRMKQFTARVYLGGAYVS